MLFLFGFQGRIKRATAWLCLAVVAVADLLLAETGAPVVLVCSLGVIVNIALLAFVARRMHDFNRSAWWIFGYAAAVAMIVPALFDVDQETLFDKVIFVVGRIGLSVLFGLLIELLARPGTRGPNRFGPDPLAN
jgi:uncharacterized membrane protein YhaH (DUF805 family)